MFGNLKSPIFSKLHILNQISSQFDSRLILSHSKFSIKSQHQGIKKPTCYEAFPKDLSLIFSKKRIGEEEDAADAVSFLFSSFLSLLFFWTMEAEGGEERGMKFSSFLSLTLAKWSVGVVFLACMRTSVLVPYPVEGYCMHAWGQVSLCHDMCPLAAPCMQSLHVLPCHCWCDILATSPN